MSKAHLTERLACLFRAVSQDLILSGLVFTCWWSCSIDRGPVAVSMLWVIWLLFLRQSNHIRGLQQVEKRYNLLADSITDGVMRMRLDGSCAYASVTASSLLGYEACELIDREYALFACPEQVEEVRRRFRDVAAGRADEPCVHRCLRADGQVIWLQITFRLVRSMSGRPREVVMVLRNVTERRKAEERLRHLAAVDVLTGLPNRRVFAEAIASAIGGGCAVLFIDLDRFKPVNDIHGHAVGDRLLIEVTSRLQADLPYGAVLARLGGDEFGLLLQHCRSDAEAACHADALLAALARPIEIGSIQVEIGASVGVSRAPRDGDTADALLRTADIAMYRAKRSGGGWVFFKDRMESELKDQVELKAQLRDAIQCGDVLPYYQPLVNLGSGEIVGFEVLARWRHREKGLLPPSRFIAPAEEAGLIPFMFTTILRQACLDACRWPGALKIAVNISPTQLQDRSLSQQILEVLAATGLPASRLEIEVTESGLVHDMETAKRGLATLRSAGIRTALDDFGTGYSGMLMLKELKVDRLKIDRSFVQAVATDPESGRYVSAIIGLADALGLQTLAEGIEDESTMQRVADMGCALGQGYLFGHPRPADELHDWLRSYGPAGQDAGKRVTRDADAELALS